MRPAQGPLHLPQPEHRERHQGAHLAHARSCRAHGTLPALSSSRGANAAAGSVFAAHPEAQSCASGVKAIRDGLVAVAWKRHRRLCVLFAGLAGLTSTAVGPRARGPIKTGADLLAEWAMRQVFQLAGKVGEKAAYHHGDASLNSTIVGLAQNFVGSNNINLLDPSGAPPHPQPRPAPPRRRIQIQQRCRDCACRTRRNHDGSRCSRQA